MAILIWGLEFSLHQIKLNLCKSFIIEMVIKFIWFP